MMERAGHAIGPVTIGIMRLGGGSLVLTGALVALGRSHHIAREHWKHILLVSLIGNAWPFVLVPLLVTRGYGHSYFGVLV